MTSRVIYEAENMTPPHQAIENLQPNLFGRYAEKDVQHLVTLDNAGRHVSLCNQWTDHLPFEVQSWEYPDLPICVRCLQTSGQLRRLVVWVKAGYRRRHKEGSTAHGNHSGVAGQRRRLERRRLERR